MKKSKRFLALSVATLAGLIVAANLWAANFTVDCFDDAPDADLDDSTCEITGPCTNGTGLCTLRAAIQTANTPDFPVADEITLPAGTYTIQTFPCDDTDGIGNIGDFDITSNITINGAGAQSTIIDGNGMDRIFEVRSPEPFDASATLRGMTIQNGLAAQCQEFLEDGGGILVGNTSTLNLDRVAVVNNVGSDGGGIANFGSLSILNSTISGNEAQGFACEGTCDGSGGGIFNEPGSFAIPQIPQAISLPETMPIVNTTISGNSAREFGGGIASTGGSLALRNATITDNDAGDGGGVTLLTSFIPTLTLGKAVIPGQAEFLVRNTIIAKNTHVASESISPDCLLIGDEAFMTTEGFNLIGNNAGCGLEFVDGVNGDQVGSETQPIDPFLGPLADNGGPTFTHALLTNSTAIDLANPAGCFANDTNDGAALLIDQRGLTRPADGNGDANVRCDIGAFEVQPLCGNGTVNTNEECDDGNLTNGDGCAADCTIEPFCGDHELSEGETCDDGNNTNGDGCSAECQDEVPGEECGNGIVETGEECDGPDSAEGGCETDCTLSPFCGDGVVDPGEECDDKNNVTGDGCSSTCRNEAGISFLLGGFGCSLAPAVAGGAGFASSVGLMAGTLAALLVKRRKIR